MLTISSILQLTGDVTETIENARNIIANMPKAKKDLGPLLDALTRTSSLFSSNSIAIVYQESFSVSTEPLMQIIGGVGLVLNGVLTLLGNILNGIGLGGLLNGILDALGLSKLLGRYIHLPPSLSPKYSTNTSTWSIASA